MNGYVFIPLTPNEVFAAAHHALIRRMGNLNGLRQEHRVNPDHDPWDNDIEASGAEMAFNKYFDKFWTGLSGLRAPDARWGEVRWTRHKDTGGLIVYPKDDDQRRFVLMDGYAPEYRVVGWMYGWEAKQPPWFKQREGYFLVPRGSIWAFEEPKP